MAICLRWIFTMWAPLPDENKKRLCPEHHFWLAKLMNWFLFQCFWWGRDFYVQFFCVVEQTYRANDASCSTSCRSKWSTLFVFPSQKIRCMITLTFSVPVENCPADWLVERLVRLSFWCVVSRNLLRPIHTIKSSSNMFRKTMLDDF